MTRVVSRVKQVVPWPLKVVLKIVLARLPVSGRAWQRIGMFSPGEMLDSGYATSVFDRHFEAAGRPAPGFRFAELGPGDSLASAFIGAARGAAGCWLIDAGAFAADSPIAYTELVESLDWPDGPPALDGSFDRLMNELGCSYLESGLDGLRSLPAESCDFLFSQAVLEHVKLAEFAETIAETFRVLVPGGVASHVIDFKDHLGESLNHLRFADRLWHADWFAWRSGFYTNRLRLSEMVSEFTEVGFSTEFLSVSRFDTIPIERARLQAAFQGVPDDDLLVHSVQVRLTRPG